MVDVFHTIFGVAGAFVPVKASPGSDSVEGLSLLGYPGLVDLDPVYCMPASVIESRGLRKEWEALPRRM